MRYSITEFHEIYQHCFPRALRQAVAMLHDEEEANDIAQEVFLRLWEMNQTVDNPPAFILRAVRNSCLNRISAMDVRDRFLRGISLDDMSPDNEPLIDATQLQNALQLLLSPREREIVDLIYSQGLSYKDAACQLKVSPSLINKNIVSALKKLRSHFRK